ncbi:hypothetical protein ACQCSX_03805 [Pseudarthrobacter sp. P1]|uniref:hypothetical protein n=1 Tax=Pseudarthrobacter sp. P1 TaxID=3418418 RepID=UPI003CF521BA
MSTSEAAPKNRHELFPGHISTLAATGPAPEDIYALLAPLKPDSSGGLDGVRDTANMPLADEPPRVQDALAALGVRTA